jgi:hypothetical protein
LDPTEGQTRWREAKLSVGREKGPKGRGEQTYLEVGKVESGLVALVVLVRGDDGELEPAGSGADAAGGRLLAWRGDLVRDALGHGGGGHGRGEHADLAGLHCC